MSIEKSKAVYHSNIWGIIFEFLDINAIISISETNSKLNEVFKKNLNCLNSLQLNFPGKFLVESEHILVNSIPNEIRRKICLSNYSPFTTIKVIKLSVYSECNLYIELDN